MEDQERKQLYNVENVVFDNSVQLGSSAPADKYYFVLFECMMLGLSTLILFNSVITAIDWFSYVYSDYKKAVQFLLSFVYNFPQVFIMLLLIQYGPKLSFPLRNLSSLSVFLFALIFIPLFTIIPDSAISQLTNMIIVLTVVFISAIFGSTLFASVLGLCACLPVIYTTAAMSGMGVGGALVGLVRIITIAIFPTTGSDQNQDDENLLISTMIFFGIAASLVFLTFVGYVIMMRTAFYKFYLNKYYSATVEKEQMDQSLIGVDALDGVSWSEKTKRKIKERAAEYWRIFKMIWIHALSVFFVFFITLTLFPGVTNLILPVETSTAYFAVLMVFEFNLFDFVGRTTPMVPFLRFPERFLWIFVVLRLVFIPLMILCVCIDCPSSITKANSEYHAVLNNDAYSYIIMAFFAFTNGYTGTLCMMYAPSRVPGADLETVGIIMSFFLESGIFVASFVSLGVGKLLTMNT